jgi:hypothetical protein
MITGLGLITGLRSPFLSALALGLYDPRENQFREDNAMNVFCSNNETPLLWHVPK